MSYHTQTRIILPIGTHSFFPIRVLWAVIISSLLGLGMGAIFFGILAGVVVLSSSSVVSLSSVFVSSNEKTASIKSSTNEYDFLVFTGFATHFFCPLGKTNLYFLFPLFFPLVTVACFLPVLELWSITAN